MQKVEGSSPFIRFHMTRWKRGVFSAARPLLILPRGLGSGLRSDFMATQTGR